MYFLLKAKKSYCMLHDAAEGACLPMRGGRLATRTYRFKEKDDKSYGFFIWTVLFVL